LLPLKCPWWLLFFPTLNVTFISCLPILDHNCKFFLTQMDKPIGKFEYTFGAVSNTHYWPLVSKVFWVNLTNNHVNLYFKELGNTTLEQMEGLAYQLCTQLRKTRKVDEQNYYCIWCSDHLDNCKICYKLPFWKKLSLNQIVGNLQISFWFEYKVLEFSEMWFNDGIWSLQLPSKSPIWPAKSIRALYKKDKKNPKFASWRGAQAK
jgi:hypothetical protein